jgi:hypothetical protein
MLKWLNKHLPSSKFSSEEHQTCSATWGWEVHTIPEPLGVHPISKSQQSLLAHTH